MLYSALGCFGLAAVLGLYLLTCVLTGKYPIKIVAMIHGLLAITGIGLLSTYSYFYSPSPKTSLVLFIFAALGGITMFFKDLTGKPLPKYLALGHGATAIIALILLVVFILT